MGYFIKVKGVLQMAEKLINLSKIKVKEIMKRKIITIKSDSPAGDAAKIMLRNKIHGLPIVDAENEKDIINIVTSFDLLGLSYYGRFSKDTDYINITKVTKLTEDQILISLPPDANIKEAMKIIAEKNIRSIPIVDDGKLVGIVSVVDIIRIILSLTEGS